MSETTPTSDVLAGWGFTARLEGAWEGRLYLRPTPRAAFSQPSARASTGSAAAGALGWAGESTAPVLHLGNFPLPASRGDFGSGAVDRMAARHAFVSLLEFGEAERGTALFAPQGVPRPRLAEFSPSTLQRRLPGQLGYQRFFSVGDRPMCLFVVLGGAAGAASVLAQVTAVLDRVEVA